LKHKFPVILVLSVFLLSACEANRNDHVGPVISDVSTSDKVLVISDCPATSVTISARVVDTSKIASVLLWYRVDSGEPYASTPMEAQTGLYSASVKGSDLQGNGYGSLEFYITAEDERGNSSKSAVDTSIQFLPCVNN